MTPDRITTLVGITLGALHQVSTVGILPVTMTDWAQTAASLGLAILGYYTNKR